MESIKAHLYGTKAAANNAVKLINQGENIPQPNSTTQTYCEPIEVVEGWAIVQDDVTFKYLGEGVDVTLIQTEI
jgi:hypothetical protein